MVTNSNRSARVRAHSASVNVRPACESSAARAAFSNEGGAVPEELGPERSRRGAIELKDALSAKGACAEISVFSIASTNAIVSAKISETRV
jgi:hypothetical protein